jgi:hypothetical protein
MMCGTLVLQKIIIKAEPEESPNSVVHRAEEAFLEQFPIINFSKEKKLELRFAEVSVQNLYKEYTFEVTAEVEINEDSAIAALHALCSSVKLWAGRPTRQGASNLLELVAIAEAKFPKK